MELSSLDQFPDASLVSQRITIFSRFLLHLLDCLADWHAASKDAGAQTLPSLASAGWWCLLNSANLISLKCYPDSAFISISLITDSLNCFPSICLLSPYPAGWSSQHTAPALSIEVFRILWWIEGALDRARFGHGGFSAQQNDACSGLHLRKIYPQINWGKWTEQQRWSSWGLELGRDPRLPVCRGLTSLFLKLVAFLFTPSYNSPLSWTCPPLKT